MLKEHLSELEPSLRILTVAKKDPSLAKAVEAYQKIAVKSGYLEIMRRPNTVNDFILSIGKLSEEELEKVNLAFEDLENIDNHLGVDKVIAVEQHRLKTFVIKLAAIFAAIIGLIFVMVIAYNSVVSMVDPNHNVLNDSLNIFMEIFKVLF